MLIKGITEGIHTISNEDGMNKTIELAKRDFNGLVFTNLVDFDAVYGHRRNAVGYGDAIEAFDRQLETLMSEIRCDDLIMITADHGNDPTWTGTDHTREHLRFINVQQNIKMAYEISRLLESYAVIGATIADNFSVENPGIGFSILEKLEEE